MVIFAARVDEAQGLVGAIQRIGGEVEIGLGVVVNLLGNQSLGDEQPGAIQVPAGLLQLQPRAVDLDESL